MTIDYKAQLVLEGFPVERVEEFLSWHRRAPHVWKTFEKAAIRRAKSGERAWGAMAFINEIRWEEEIPGGEDFKVNNNWAPFYARVFHLKYPEYKGFFITKKPKGEGLNGIA